MVDAEELLRDAAHAEEVLADSNEDRARDLLAEVDALYRGDAFDDEPYEAWADGLRGRRSGRRGCGRCAGTPGSAAVRATSTPPSRTSSGCSPPTRTMSPRTMRSSGRSSSAGQHGEGRRAFDRWTHAMEHIDAPPPDREVLAGRPRAPRPAVVRLPDDPVQSRSVTLVLPC